MKSSDIRKKFQAYFMTQGHNLMDSSTLIPKKDPTLLFTNAGMNPFKDYFLGLADPSHSEVCTIQKCMRAGGKHNDLEQVGLSPYHHTFFEMMGNFSFGSYFKKEAIHYALDFLTKTLHLPANRLWVSVFKQDKESAEIWKKDQNFPVEKIFFLGEKDNFWRMGNTGPCGPCTEIYYYDGPKKQPQIKDMTEIWNLVFMEFNEYIENGQKKQKLLPKPCVDTGMGLERLSAVLQEKKSNYNTDLFKGIIKSLEQATGLRYEFEQMSQEENQVAFRVMADHSRAIAFLIGDGVLPASEGAGYVLRRLLRRALFYGQKLSSRSDILCVSAQNVVLFMKEVYPELLSAKELINSTIQEESRLFSESLKAGKPILLKKLSLSKKSVPDRQKAHSHKINIIDDSVVWDLYSTYGFPPDLTRLIAQEKGFLTNNLSVNQLKKKFSNPSLSKTFQSTSKQELIKKAVELHQQNQKNKGAVPTQALRGGAEGSQQEIFTGYKTAEEKAQVLLAVSVPALQGLTKQTVQNLSALFIAEGEHGFVITDKTCFYPEGGGPVGDTGFLSQTDRKPVSFVQDVALGASLSSKGDKKQEASNKTSLKKAREDLPKSAMHARVLDTQKRGDIIIHEVKVIQGQLKTGQACCMQVDKDRRRLISASHSATHLLHQALRVVLGEGVRQMGSLVEPGHLRFDFSSAPLTVKQLRMIEDKVNNLIHAGHEVFDSTCSYESALRSGALFLAGENYPKKVRLIQMGNSLEFCGGIHVKNTSEIKGFTIVSETGVSSGVRRILAYVSDIRQKWLLLMAQQNKDLREHLNWPLPKLNQTGFVQDAASEIFPSYKVELKLRNANKTNINQTAHKAENPFIAVIKKKDIEINNLRKQISKLSSSLSQGTREALKEKALPFECKGLKALLWAVALPIEDRKVLAETADNIKAQSPKPAVVVALGEGIEQYPIVLTVSKELQKHLSAGDLLKTHIADFLTGKGGGQTRFAQGMIKDKESFSQLGAFLIKKLSAL